VWFAQRSEMFGIAGIGAHSDIRGRAVELAGTLEVTARNLVVANRLLREVDCMAIEPGQNLVTCFRGACIICRGEFMRQVDHEAGIAASTALRHMPRVNDYDLGIRCDLAQPPGR